MGFHGRQAARHPSQVKGRNASGARAPYGSVSFMRPRSYLMWIGAALACAWSLACNQEPPEPPRADVPPSTPTPAPSKEEAGQISGQGEYRFRVRYRAKHLPRGARFWLGGAHSGFAVDRRPGRGEVYFGLAGAGIIRLSGDLSRAELIATDDAMRNQVMHNTGIWFADDGEGRLVFPAPDAECVFTTDLNGRLLNTLRKPAPGTPFTDPAAARYFDANGLFRPTDVEHLRDTYYIPTGYSDLDEVLTAGLHLHEPPGVEWGPLSFGGRGGAPGQFWTGHGITLDPDGERLSVTDRLNSEIDRFTPEGRYLETVKFPQGSQPCDIDYAYGLAVVPCLGGPDKSKGAPIYLLKDDTIVSTILPKDELGLAGFTHVHDAVLHEVDGRLHILALAWMPGDFAVLVQIKE